MTCDFETVHFTFSLSKCRIYFTQPIGAFYRRKQCAISYSPHFGQKLGPTLPVWGGAIRGAISRRRKRRNTMKRMPTSLKSAWKNEEQRAQFRWGTRDSRWTGVIEELSAEPPWFSEPPLRSASSSGSAGLAMTRRRPHQSVLAWLVNAHAKATRHLLKKTLVYCRQGLLVARQCSYHQCKGNGRPL